MNTRTLKKVFLGISALFALVPGIAIMLKGIAVPLEYEWLFGGTIEALGALTLLILLLNKDFVLKQSILTVNKVIVMLITSFFLSLTLYTSLLNRCNIQDPHDEDNYVYFPLWTTGEINKDIAEKGGRKRFLVEYGDISDDLQEMPYYSLINSFTTITLILVYQFIFTSLTAAFGILGIRLEKDEDEKEIEKLKEEIVKLQGKQQGLVPLAEDIPTHHKSGLEKLLKNYTNEREKRIELIGRIRKRLIYTTDVPEEFKLEQQLEEQEERFENLNIKIDEVKVKIEELED